MKLLIALLVALFVVSNGYWLYREFDRGVTQTYQGQVQYENANRRVAATTLANEAVRGKPKMEIEGLLKQLFPAEQIFEKEGALHTAWLSLALTSDGKIQRIEVEPETLKQAEVRSSGVVGNEVFWPKK